MRQYTVDMREEDGWRDSVAIWAEDERGAREAAEATLRDWVSGGEYGPEGASVAARWALYEQEDEDEEIASGSIIVEIEPDHAALIKAVGGDTECDHDWTSEGEGGCEENPGVWATGGTSLLIVAHCRHCQLIRTEYVTGSQRNPGDRDTCTYSLPDQED